jgi:hypothetical protein
MLKHLAHREKILSLNPSRDQKNKTTRMRPKMMVSPLPTTRTDPNVLYTKVRGSIPKKVARLKFLRDIFVRPAP